NAGAGLTANSTTFTLQRGSSFWTGSGWQTGVSNLATTHTATSGNVQTAWTSNVTLPTWASESDGTYTVRAKATDKVGNTFTGSAVSFTLDKTLISPLNIGTANDTTGLPTLTQTATVPVGERIFVTVAMDAADPTTS